VVGMRPPARSEAVDTVESAGSVGTARTGPELEDCFLIAGPGTVWE
jgi:hypothetical protein